MTMALCFNCGEIKFGAICPCPKCRVASTGDMKLDIVFSDHNYDVKTLEEFGAVLRVIRGACSPPGKAFWAFMRYLSKQHPEVLMVEFEFEAELELDLALRDLDLPPVTLRPSPMRSAEFGGPPEEATAPDEPEAA